MKYMTFNSSCSYAGLANLLSLHGVDTTDRRIALDMGLPYIFSKEENWYLAGPMLQGAKWFNLYLHPHGFNLTETEVRREELCACLQTLSNAMLGIYVSENNKHAVIFNGIKNGLYSFLNNKWEHSDEPDTLLLTEQELLSRLDNAVVIGILNESAPQAAETQHLYQTSVSTLRAMQQDIHTFCAQEHTPQELRQAMNPLFRPLLVDAITMTDLLGEAAIHDWLKSLQSQFMNVIRSGHSTRPADSLDLAVMDEAVCRYIDLIYSKENS